eukprot:CFRG5862T1
MTADKSTKSAQEGEEKVESPMVSRSPESVELTKQEKDVFDELDLLPVITYLRKNVRTEWSATHEKRCEYFRGLAAVKCLFKSNKFGIKRKAGAVYVMERLLSKGEYFHQAEKIKTPSGAKKLQPIHITKQKFLPDQTPYIWTFDVQKWLNTVLGVGVLGSVFAGTLFPLWPQFMRDGVYYLSMVAIGLIVLFFATCIVRLILFSIIWACTGGNTYFWLYPNLLREDDDFWGSFVPFTSWEYKVAKTGEGAAAHSSDKKTD